MVLFATPRDHILWDATPRQLSRVLCPWGHGPVFRASLYSRYKCHRFQPCLEACNGHCVLPCPCGSYDTSSRPWDGSYLDHTGADGQSSPWFWCYQKDGQEQFLSGFLNLWNIGWAVREL